MKVKQLAVALVAALATAGALAAQSVTFSGNAASFSLTPTAGAFTQEFDFFGLNPGTYDTFGNFSAQNIIFTSVTLDGMPWQLLVNLGKFSFGAVQVTGPAPMQMVFTGIAGSGATASGQFSVDPNPVVTTVPEPESLAMMLAGLGLMATIARRRKQG